MSIDVIERRRAVEERLRRARNLAVALNQATGDVASSSGLSIDDLDPDSSLRTALSALAGVAALRPGFDVLVSLPNSPFSLRVRHLDNDVDISVVPHGSTTADGPVQPGTAPAGPGPGASPEPEEHVVSDLAAMLWQGVNAPPN